MISWDAYNLILLIARSGTLSATAKHLGVNQTTVARRLAAAETSAGATLFQRLGGRLVPTATGAPFVSAAEAMETALTQVAAPDAGIATVRISALPMVIDQLIAPNIGDFIATHPGIVLELVASTSSASLARREAEIALRLTRPSEGRLIIRKARDIRFRLAAKRSIAGSFGYGMQYLAYEREQDELPEIAVLRARYQSEPIARFGSVSALLAAVKSGTGAAMLPDHLINKEPDLQILDEDCSVIRSLWIVFHESHKDRKAIRIAADWLAVVLSKANSETPHPSDKFTDQKR